MFSSLEINSGGGRVKGHYILYRIKFFVCRSIRGFTRRIFLIEFFHYCVTIIIIIITNQHGGTKAAQTEKDMDTADERGFVVLQARGHCYDKVRTAAA